MAVDFQRDAGVRVAHQTRDHCDRRPLCEQAGREAVAQGLDVTASQFRARARWVDTAAQDVRSPQRFSVVAAEY